MEQICNSKVCECFISPEYECECYEKVCDVCQKSIDMISDLKYNNNKLALQNTELKQTITRLKEQMNHYKDKYYDIERGIIMYLCDELVKEDFSETEDIQVLWQKWRTLSNFSDYLFSKLVDDMNLLPYECNRLKTKIHFIYDILNKRDI